MSPRERLAAVHKIRLGQYQSSVPKQEPKQSQHSDTEVPRGIPRGLRDYEIF